MEGVKRPLTFQTREVGVIKGRKWKRYRGYYMAARRYEISLRVLKYFFNTRREISYLQAAM